MTQEAIEFNRILENIPPSRGSNNWGATIILGVFGPIISFVLFAGITYAFDITFSGMVWEFMAKYVVPISYPDCQIFTSIPLNIWMARGWAKLAS